VTTFRSLHLNFAWFVIIANGLAGAWSVGANWLPALRTRAMWWFIGIAQVSIFLQVIFGVVLVARYKFEFQPFHAFYGFVAIIAVSIIYSYRFQMRHRIYLLYGLGSLFLMGLSIRGMLVGQAG
jgi:hypothetical protein